MTDLETQLRDCLSRHAAAADVSADLAVATRLRSRQLSHRRNAATVMAIVPVTAVIVIGAVALGGTSSRSSELLVRPLASSTAVSPTAPMTSPHGLSNCKAGTVPDVAPLSRQRFFTSGGPQTVTDLLHFLRQRFNLKLASVAWVVGNDNKRFDISGSPANRHEQLLKVVIRGRHHQPRQIWFVLVHHDNKLLAERARFLGCGSPPNS